MMTCRTQPTIMITNLPKRIYSPPINFKEALFQRNNALLQQKRQQYRQEIFNVIEELKKESQNLPLVKMIKFIDENEVNQNLKEVLKDGVKDETIDRMLTILKKALLEERVTLYQSQQRLQYEENVRHNISFAQISVFKDKKWFELFTSLENLVKIDQIAYFFHSNSQYASKCYLQYPIWCPSEIVQLFDISSDELGHLRRFFNSHHNLFGVNRMSKVGQLVSVLTLARYKNRILRLKMRCLTDNQQIYQSKHEEIENISRQKQIQGFVQLRLKEIFRFSQIAIFTREKQLYLYPILHKKNILQKIEHLYHQRAQDNKKRIIKSLMMEFRMSINSIENFLRNIRNNQPQKNNAYFAQNIKGDLHLLYKNLKYIFACKLLQCKAFQSLKLQQNYDTKLDYQFIVYQCKTDVLTCFSKASLAVFKQYILTSALHLSIEATFQPILAISKFYISYRSFKGLSQEDEQEDSFATLVIATKAKKIVFYKVYREKLSNEKYLTQLRKMIKQQKTKFSQPIVLYERQIVNLFSWYQLRKFIDDIFKQSRSRVYVSVQPLYCDLNIYLFSCLLKYIKIFDPLISKATFYPLCEQFNEKIIRLFKKAYD